MFWEKHTNTKHKTEKQQRLCVSLFHLHLGQISEAPLFFSFSLSVSLTHTYTHKQTQKDKEEEEEEEEAKEEEEREARWER